MKFTDLFIKRPVLAVCISLLRIPRDDHLNRNRECELLRCGCKFDAGTRNFSN